MKDITLKNIPDKVYKALQKKANDHNNTIDKIIIEELENITNSKLNNDKISTDEWLERAREIRNKMKFTATEKEISDFKNIGRD